MRPFKGFPAGKSGTIHVPNVFFSDLLALIDNLASGLNSVERKVAQGDYFHFRDVE